MKRLKHIFSVSVIFLVLATSPAVTAGDWVLVSNESSIRFTGTQVGEPFFGVFNRFAADISYDPDDPAGAHVKAEIDLASVSTGDAQRDTALPTEDWFFISSFPKATFEAVGFQVIGKNRFNTAGELSLRGFKKPIVLPFELKIDGNRAEMNATITLNRADFGVGAGPWAEGKWVGLGVTVILNIVAKRRAS